MLKKKREGLVACVALLAKVQMSSSCISQSLNIVICPKTTHMAVPVTTVNKYLEDCVLKTLHQGVSNLNEL